MNPLRLPQDPTGFALSDWGYMGFGFILVLTECIWCSSGSLGGVFAVSSKYFTFFRFFFFSENAGFPKVRGAF